MLTNYFALRQSTKSLSGTSMATPHVAGLVAYLIGKDGKVSPAEMEKKVKDPAVNSLNWLSLCKFTLLLS